MYKKKINRIVIGTNNSGKVREIKKLLSKGVKIDTPKKLYIKSPKENGKTFLENSLIKARYFSKKTKEVSLSDDSGLEIDILGKQPGIYSARWAGRKSNFNKAIESSRNALPIWSNTTPLKRSRILSNYKTLIEKNICTLQASKKGARQT